MVKKRGQNEGGIYQRDDGTWEAKISLGYDVNGKRVRKSLYGPTRAEVRTKMERAMRDHAEGRTLGADRETVGHFLTRWLADAIKPYRAPKTHEQYEYLCRVHIIPAIGRTQLGKLTPEQVQRLLATKTAIGLSGASVTRMRAVLRAALNRAVKWGIMSRNVAALTDAPTRERHETVPLTLEQVNRLFKQIQGERLEALYILALATGLREGEILGLQWEDVDFARRTVMIRRQVQRTRDGLMVRELKTRGSHAIVPLASFAAEALHTHRARQEAVRQATSHLWREGGLVFPSSIGTPMEPRNLVRDWHRQRDRLGTPDCTFHNLRHTCASILYSHGVPPKDIQAVLRHSQLSITMDLYTHIFADARHATAEAMDRALRGTRVTGDGEPRTTHNA